MAEQLKSWEVGPGIKRGEYPWDLWTQPGTVWKATYGVDYFTRNFRQALHNYARNHGLKVKTRSGAEVHGKRFTAYTIFSFHGHGDES